MLESIILGIIQGVTEFFPISSTAHLVILPWFFGWEGDLSSLTFDVALHAGTLVSLLVCLWKDIKEMLLKNLRLLFLVALGTVPAGFAGVYLEDYVSGALRDPMVIASALVVIGWVMYASEGFKGKKALKGMLVLDALFIGVLQAVALVPGVSRSGITISAGLMRGMNRIEAVRFSFLLSIPVIGGATVLEGRKLIAASENYDLGLFAVGFVASMVTGVFAIKFMLRYLKNHTMNAFVIYRVVLAGVILGWLWLGE
jgi:undecaprenyl-diphosphatase